MAKVRVHFRSTVLSRKPDTEAVHSKCLRMAIEVIPHEERQMCKLLAARLQKIGQMGRECLYILSGAPSSLIKEESI